MIAIIINYRDGVQGEAREKGNRAVIYASRGMQGNDTARTSGKRQLRVKGDRA